ncbi:hypothetical protein D9M69_661080 [compost metagenome]
MFGGDQLGQLVLVPVHQLQELEHHARPTDRRRVGPGRERGLRGGHGGGHLGGIGQADLAGDGAGGGVGHILRAAGGVGGGGAGDVVVDISGADGHVRVS